MELRGNRVEEAKELYKEAIRIDPRNGRAYLGLSRCAERRRDYKLARECLKTGIANSVSFGENGVPDRGANPFLLQALGCLEEKAGHLNQAEALFIEAARSRPSHAASWVALAQLRTEKLRQLAMAGSMLPNGGKGVGKGRHETIRACLNVMGGYGKQKGRRCEASSQVVPPGIESRQKMFGCLVATRCHGRQARELGTSRIVL